MHCTVTLLNTDAWFKLLGHQEEKTGLEQKEGCGHFLPSKYQGGRGKGERPTRLQVPDGDPGDGLLQEEQVQEEVGGKDEDCNKEGERMWCCTKQ